MWPSSTPGWSGAAIRGPSSRKSRNSPWNGAVLVGRCTHTFVGGRLVHELDRGRTMRGAVLALADGTAFEGTSFGAPGRSHGRGGLQHLDDRLSGDPHRSFLRRPDGVHDLPRTGQLRGERRGPGVGQATRDRVHRPALGATSRPPGAPSGVSTPTRRRTASSASVASTPGGSRGTCAPLARRWAPSRAA